MRPPAITRDLARAIGTRVKRLVGLSPGTQKVRWGNLRRLTPIDRHFGYSRGGPIDRYYIESFLAKWANDVRGHVLEVKGADYTERFGGADVAASHVLDVDPGNRSATIIADLNRADNLPNDVFDCIILTQTLQYIHDLGAALADLHRSLKPGGVLLLTVPGITPIRTGNPEWYWSFTAASVGRLVKRNFDGDVTITSRGNILSATALLYGLSHREFKQEELEFVDQDYPVIVTARAVKM